VVISSRTPFVIRAAPPTQVRSALYRGPFGAAVECLRGKRPAVRPTSDKAERP
jgi:hypothetical protein